MGTINLCMSNMFILQKQTKMSLESNIEIY